MTLPIVMYGSYTCEDTALVRDRLKVLRVPFTERTKEDDENVVALLGKYNAGQLRTPTLVFGDERNVIAEPTLEQLENLLLQAGYTFDAPQMRRFNVKRYIPDLSNWTLILPHTGNVVRDFSRTLLFFAHAPACRVCQGYAKQIVAQQAKIEETGTRLQIVLPANIEQGKEWGKEFAATTEIFADINGDLKREAVDCFPDTWDIRIGGTWLWLIQDDEVVRAGVYAPDAGGLATPTEIIRFLKEQK